MAYESESVFLSKILDFLGYSHYIVKTRQHYYNEAVQTFSLDEQYELIITGSKSEGLTTYMENDFDVMVVTSEIICANDPNKYRDICEEVLALAVDKADTSPGYTRLYFQGSLHGFDPLVNYLDRCAYLSNYKFKQFVEQVIMHENLDLYSESIHGPALLCHIDPESFLDVDFVACLICDCPDILHSWLNRARFNDWPSADAIGTISAMEAHAVPVGFKGSQYEAIEWRICFTKAENKLVQNFNDCQRKLLVILRWIAKSELKSISKEMTSYVMKNVVLWLIELYPGEIFIEKNLIMILKGALRFIKICLIKNNLPSYMIMERNLLLDRVSFRKRSRLCRKIDLLQSEGPRLVLRCDKVKSAYNIMNISPRTLSMYSEFRQRAELFLIACGRDAEPSIELLMETVNMVFPNGLDFSVFDMNMHELVQFCIARLLVFLS